MRRRSRNTLLVALGLAIAFAVVLVLRQKAPPEAARLLPESDAIVYVHLKTLRTLSHFDASSVKRSPDFQHFIDATGIVPERDLDVAAFALHRMANPKGPNGPVAYSEVFVGRFDGQRLNRNISQASPTLVKNTLATRFTAFHWMAAHSASPSLVMTRSPPPTCRPRNRFIPCSTVRARRH